MAGREEQKRRDWHVERAVTAAKRALAGKVLAAIEGEHLISYQAANGRCEADIAYDKAIEHVAAAIKRVFTESGVEVEGGSDAV
jgi:hypothetical protein